MTEIATGIRLLICGDRHWTDSSLIAAWIDRIKPLIVIEGEAKGADSLARDIAVRRGIPVKKFPANWTLYGRAAGPIRNQQMINEGHPDFVLAFHDNIKSSKGTSNMIERAKKADIPWKVISHVV